MSTKLAHEIVHDILEPKMAERKRWTEEEMRVFEKAREMFKKIEPEVEEMINNFNESNTAGIHILFIESLEPWPAFVATVQAKETGKRAERVDVHGAVHIINQEEANKIGAFALILQNKFGFKVSKEPDFDKEITQLTYLFKPHYKRKGRIITDAFFKPVDD